MTQRGALSQSAHGVKRISKPDLLDVNRNRDRGVGHCAAVMRVWLSLRQELPDAGRHLASFGQLLHPRRASEACRNQSRRVEPRRQRLPACAPAGSRSEPWCQRPLLKQYSPLADVLTDRDVGFRVQNSEQSPESRLWMCAEGRERRRTRALILVSSFFSRWLVAREKAACQKRHAASENYESNGSHNVTSYGICAAQL